MTQVVSVDLSFLPENTVAVFNFASGSKSVEVKLYPQVNSTKVARILSYMNSDSANDVSWSEAYEYA